MTSGRDANEESAVVAAAAAAVAGADAAEQAEKAVRDTRIHAEGEGEGGAPTWATVRPAVIAAVGAAEAEAAGSATARSGASRWRPGR